MFYRPEQIDEEIKHQEDLLSTYTKNVRRLEWQIGQAGGEAHASIGQLNQRDSNELERTKALTKIQELEKAKGASSASTAGAAVRDGPDVVVNLLLHALPTGILHLYSHDNLPLLKYAVTNPTPSPMSVILSSSIEQFSYTRSDTITLEPGETQNVRQLPTLKFDEIAGIFELRNAVLHTRVSYLKDGHERLLFAQDHDVQFLARDVLTWAIIDDQQVTDLSYQLGAWVTPNAQPLVELIRTAADYSPTGELYGYQGGGTTDEQATTVRMQIKAIFEALKYKGQITYTNASISFGEKQNEVRQRISLPRQSLATRQANCVDGVVLYASLIERLGMNPVMVLIAGHAFVGWETWSDSAKFEFLETTLTHSTDFETAWKSGCDRFAAVQSQLGRPLFDPQGFAVMHQIKRLRQTGVTPAE